MKALKNLFNLLIVMTATTILTFCSSPVESGEQNPANSDDLLYSMLDQTALEDLSAGEKDGLIFMREEEKLARDVYIVLYEKWNRRVFNNISQSEQRHTNAVLYLINRYGINDPVSDDGVGVFTNPDLQNLYNQLTDQGTASLEEALKVGAAIEEIDILDLDKQLNEVIDNEDIKIVYENLRNGSYNHLRAFVRNLSAIGVNYSQQYLPKDEFDKIINGSNTHGNG